MRVIINEYKLLTFLSAYLNQADLSLDRSRWDSIQKLREYYRVQIDSKKIANYVINFYKLDLDNFDSIYFTKSNSFIDKVILIFKRLLGVSQSLSISEAYYICQKLYEFHKLLKGKGNPHRLEIEKLRIEIAQFNSSIMKFKLSNKDWKKITRIEHYLQNEISDCIKVDEFIPDDF